MSVIGNRLKLAFELIPVTPSWARRYRPERAAWAGTAIWAGGKNLCSHVVPGSSEIRDFLFVPLGPIVDWLVQAFAAIEFQGRAPVFRTTRDLHGSVERWGDTRPPPALQEDDWLDAREEWWSRHFLRAGADGARVPNLAFVRDDEELVVTWAPPRFFGYGAPTMLSPEGEFALPWLEGQSVLEEFASSVAAWLRQSDAADVYPWAREQHPLRSAAPSLPQAIELFTGRRLDDLQELFGIEGFEGLLKTLHLQQSSGDPAASPQCQILRDLSPGLSSDVGGLLIDLGDAATRERPRALETWRDARQIALDAARPARSPEEAGQLAAPEIRRALGLDGEPIDDLPAALTRLGLSYGHTHVEGGYDQMMVALRDGGSPTARTLQTPRTLTKWGQRFEACRALGHILLDPIRAGAIGAASGPFAEATRRRRSGAFAAELLLPETAVAEASAHQLDGAAEDHVFEGLLERYGIGARAAAFQVWNRGWLSSPDIRDELIDRFGSTDLAQ
jgi:hypothetical protein